MTAVDMPRWSAALRRLCAGYDKQLAHGQADAWYEQLERYPIDAVEQAFRDAPAEAGRFFPTVGLLEQLTKKHTASTPRRTGDWHAPEVMRDADGKVTVAYRCGLCCDTGWRGVLTASGLVLTEAELQEWETNQKPTAPREDGRRHGVRRRCACRTGGTVQHGRVA